MKKLLAGIYRFQKEIFPLKKALFERLASGQQPEVLMITCSDSRIDPALITQPEPGDLFVLRNAGNIVPPYGALWGGEAATIEYAVDVLKVRHIVVCGHSRCGAMSALLQPEQARELPAVRQWLVHAEETARRVREKFSNVEDPEALLLAAIEQNVLVQLEHLRTHPSVASAVERGELQLHGWMYRFEIGQIYFYEATAGTFVPAHQSSLFSEQQLA